MKNTEQLQVLKAMSSPSGFHILSLLYEGEDLLCVNQIAKVVGITPSAVSHQMAKLEEIKVVEPTRNGQMVCYKLSKTESANIVRDIMKSLLS